MTNPQWMTLIVHYRRILLPIDSSRRAETSLSVGIALSRGETTTGNKEETEKSISDSSPENPKLILTAIIKPPEIPIPKPYPLEIAKLSEAVNGSQPKSGGQLS